MDLTYPAPGQIEAAWALLCAAAIVLPAALLWLLYPTDDTD